MLYNLAQVYKDGGDVAMAKEAYDKLLARHQSMSIQAQMLADLDQSNEARDLLKTSHCVAKQQSISARSTPTSSSEAVSRNLPDISFLLLSRILTSIMSIHYTPLTKFNITKAGKVETRVRRA
ncbi:hypothetical protein BDR05DRAFT_966029 [Suillus weaverae]|nr:hypothetical protein BDR05DRAFT_966029 [Suillus weaverae]